MQRLIQHKETLIYYDGPQLFSAYDQFRTPYLCLLVEQDDDADQFLCVPISPTRLELFYQGRIDLRTIYDAPESAELFYVQIGNEERETYPLFSLAEVSTEWLPDSNFFFQQEISYDGEQIELIGRITQADLQQGTWALHSIPDNLPYRGFLSDAMPLSLSGLILGDQLYKFICQQRVEVRQERVKLYLVEYQSLPKAA